MYQENNELSNRDYSVALAGNTALRSAAYQLRYRVYITEQRKPYPDVDHEQNWFTDELDCDAAIIVVSGVEGPCGTVRACFADCEVVRTTYYEQFELNRF